jgi:hypothetical protein
MSHEELIESDFLTFLHFGWRYIQLHEILDMWLICLWLLHVQNLVLLYTWTNFYWIIPPIGNFVLLAVTPRMLVTIFCRCFTAYASDIFLFGNRILWCQLYAAKCPRIYNKVLYMYNQVFTSWYVLIDWMIFFTCCFVMCIAENFWYRNNAT